jgi:hypothetical protein
MITAGLHVPQNMLQMSNQTRGSNEISNDFGCFQAHGSDFLNSNWHLSFGSAMVIIEYRDRLVVKWANPSPSN